MATLNGSYQLLAESGYYTFLASYNGQVCLRLYARVSSQDVSSNCSVVDVKITKYLIGTSAQVKYTCDNSAGSLSGDLTATYSSGRATYSAYNEYTLIEQSFTVWHNDDGTKSLTLGATYDDTFIAPLSTGQVVCTLPAIARATTIGVVHMWAIEDGIGVTFTPAVSHFWHNLIVNAGGQTVLVRENYTSGAWVSPTAEELLTFYRIGSPQLQIILDTYNGASYVGRHNVDTALLDMGNMYLRVGGQWKRGVIYVGGKPGVMMVRVGGEWKVAR